MKNSLLLFGILTLVALGQDGSSRISGPQPKVPPLPPPPALRPIRSPTNSIVIETNANGDVISRTTVVLKRAENRQHYYGVINSEVVYLGEWLSDDYEKWAYTGSQATGNLPQLTQWHCIFKTTNRISPELVYYKLCP